MLPNKDRFSRGTAPKPHRASAPELREILPRILEANEEPSTGIYV